MLLLLERTHDSDPGLPTRGEIVKRCHWNLWSRRLYPFKDLFQGARVLPVESWPRGGTLTWEVAARPLVTGEYRSKADAARQIASTLGLDERNVRNHSYTKQGPPAGFFVALRFKPIRRLGLPWQPGQPRFQPNGWLKVEDPKLLKSWGIEVDSSS